MIIHILYVFLSFNSCGLSPLHDWIVFFRIESFYWFYNSFILLLVYVAQKDLTYFIHIYEKIYNQLKYIQKYRHTMSIRKLLKIESERLRGPRMKRKTHFLKYAQVNNYNGFKIFHQGIKWIVVSCCIN